MTFIWDYIIISFLVASVIFLGQIWKNWPRPFICPRDNHTRFRLGLAVFFILTILVLIYGSLIEPQLIWVKHVSVNIKKTTAIEDLKIAQISDLHAGNYHTKYYWQRVANRLIALQPDIIVLTGDYILGKGNQVSELEPIFNLGKKYPVYAVTGNHEYALSSAANFDRKKFIDKTEPLKKILQDNNVHLLENEGQIISTRVGEVYLVGIKELWTQEATINDELLNLNAQVQIDVPRILLAHNPEIINYNYSDYFDLILSGHTHGGQIRLPLIGSIAPMPTNLGRHYDRGLFELPNKNQLYINQGLGEAGPRARLFCPPEITLFNINL